MISKHLHWSEENYRKMHMLIDSADAHDKLSARWSGCTATTVVHHHQTGRLSIAHVPRSGWVLVISPLVQLWCSMHFFKRKYTKYIHIYTYYIYTYIYIYIYTYIYIYGCTQFYKVRIRVENPHTIQTTIQTLPGKRSSDPDLFALVLRWT